MNISTPCKKVGRIITCMQNVHPREDATIINKVEEENGQGTLAQALRRNAMYESNML